jgi:hypothetical protein
MVGNSPGIWTLPDVGTNGMMCVLAKVGEAVLWTVLCRCR